MLVRFAARSPERDCAIAYAVAAGPACDARLGTLEGSIGELARGSAATTGFAGEMGSVVEFFVPNGARARRMLLAGLGPEAIDTFFEKLGATLVAQLLTSGETRLAARYLSHPVSSQAPAEPGRDHYRRGGPGGGSSVVEACGSGRGRDVCANTHH